jgi:hypothetical protein
MKRKGFGAACTAVLVKLRFPRMSYEDISMAYDSASQQPTSKACVCTWGLASLRFWATTMFAILPLSSGLNARGDLEVLLSPKAGDSEIGGNYNTR